MIMCKSLDVAPKTCNFTFPGTRRWGSRRYHIAVSHRSLTNIRRWFRLSTGVGRPEEDPRSCSLIPANHWQETDLRHSNVSRSGRPRTAHLGPYFTWAPFHLKER